MQFEIRDDAISFHLHGISAVVENERYGEVGMRLMNEMWQVVKGAKIPTTGVNHWVYLPEGKMFVGVELRSPDQQQIPEQLVPLQFELQRYLKHVHVGAYQELPQKWQALKSALRAGGEEIAFPSLEVYGHHCEDATKLETTILIGLSAKGTDESPT